MKKLLSLLLLLLLFTIINAQPWLPLSGGTLTGNLGIGITTPRANLDLGNTGTAMLKEIHFVSDDVGFGAENSDFYSLRKVHDSSNASHLDLYLQDDADESFRIYARSEGYGGNLYHSFKADGSAYHAGRLGIGTVNPRERLDVWNGAVMVTGIDSSCTAIVTTRGGLAYYGNGNLNGIMVSTVGNVGIGTNSITSNYKLAVEGTIGARKIKVTQASTWPDYVFDSSYQLKPLRELERFIKINKHLPEVPSALEVEKVGIDVGDNQALLLKKIEELSLYMIDMKKENDMMKQEIQILQNESMLQKITIRELQSK